MVDCTQFLEEYSAFRDRLLSDPRREQFDEHLRACASCARYDRVISRGVALFRHLDAVEPSPDFAGKLQHRIYHVEEELRHSRHSSSGRSIAFMVAIAAAIGASAWAPTLREKPALVELPAVVANAPPPVEHVPLLFRTGPLLTANERPAVAAANQTLFFRYSPIGLAVGGRPMLQTVQADHPQH